MCELLKIGSIFCDMVDNTCVNILSKTHCMQNFYIIDLYCIVLTDCA